MTFCTVQEEQMMDMLENFTNRTVARTLRRDVVAYSRTYDLNIV